MSKQKTTGTEKWFVRFCHEHRWWEVMQGGFRHNTYHNKFEAEQERDRLNALDGFKS